MRVIRMINSTAPLLGLGSFAFLSACVTDLTDTRFDHGIDSKPLSQLEAQVWVDPEGCDHLIIDDGVESYMNPRLHADGTPVCRPEAVPETIYNFVK
jgi:hypothetical protein